MLIRHATLAMLLLASPLGAEEGMWPFEHLPRTAMKAAYNFEPSSAWLDHARRSTLRFPGGTGSFISADGLVITNHHVAHGWILQVSTQAKNWVEQGFVASMREDELPIPGLELKRLDASFDVTAQVKARTQDGKNVSAVLDQLVRETSQRTGLQCQAMSLYEGHEHWIQAYRVFHDVRLVMAPELGIAAFGKDWDNFSYPRHDLDFALFRVYENGQPFHPEDYLKRSERGPVLGDLTVVPGFPGRTTRRETVAQVEYQRDIQLPRMVRSLDRQRRALRELVSKGGETARISSAELMSLENAAKVYSMELEQLNNPGSMAVIRRAEDDLRKAVHKDEKWSKRTSDAWTQIASVQKERARLAPEEQLLINRYRSLARGPLEGAMRLLEAEDPQDSRLLYELNVEDSAFEIQALATGLQEAQEELGAEHPLVKALLKGSTPQQVAQFAIRDSVLFKPLERSALLGIPQALARSEDPMLRLARLLNAERNRLFDRLEELQVRVEEAQARIADARFAMMGDRVSPDANLSLRLSYGSIATFPTHGTLAQPFTTWGGLFDRADGWGPTAEGGSWALPPRWMKARKVLEPSTPLNFITSNDIIGGNSGSPVLNREGCWVGIVFDGNHANPLGRFVYDPRMNRAIALDARAILESLQKVYEAPHLVREISRP